MGTENVKVNSRPSEISIAKIAQDLINAEGKFLLHSFFFFFHTNVNININFNVDKIIRRLGSIAGGNKHTTGGQCYG